MSKSLNRLTSLFSLKRFTCLLQVERCVAADVAAVFCEWSSFVMSGLGRFCLDAIHFTIEALSLAAVLIEM